MGIWGKEETPAAIYGSGFPALAMGLRGRFPDEDDWQCHHLVPASGQMTQLRPPDQSAQWGSATLKPKVFCVWEMANQGANSWSGA